MSWFERHLNWTMVLGFLGTYLASFIVGFMIAFADPTISDDALFVIGFIVSLAVLIPVWGWALKKKGRSLWWLLLGLFLPFGFIVLLCLENRSRSPEPFVLPDTLSVTDKGRAFSSYSSNSSSIGESRLRVLETVARSPGMSIDGVINTSGADVMDIDALVNAGLLRRG